MIYEIKEHLEKWRTDVLRMPGDRLANILSYIWTESKEANGKTKYNLEGALYIVS